MTEACLPDTRINSKSPSVRPNPPSMLFLIISPISCLTSASVADIKMGGNNPDKITESLVLVKDEGASIYPCTYKHFNILLEF